MLRCINNCAFPAPRTLGHDTVRFLATPLPLKLRKNFKISKRSKPNRSDARCCRRPLEPSLEFAAQQYKGRVGYQFSWGTVSEYLDTDGGATHLTFEICPNEILRQLPEPALFEDMFCNWYWQHPKASARFEAHEAMGCWDVLAFLATGKREIKALRKWMVKSFIPNIMPYILRQAQQLIAEDEFEEIEVHSEAEIAAALRAHGLAAFVPVNMPNGYSNTGESVAVPASADFSFRLSPSPFQA